MKIITTALLLTCLSVSSVFAQKTIEVKNPLDEDRLELISIPFSKWQKHFGTDTIFTVKSENGQDILPHQLEKLGTNTIQNVLIQVKIPSKGKINLQVVKGKASLVKHKTYARYVPERFDDFAWENDVVAFRMYGKALEGRPDDAQGMDYWAKRTTDLIINKWYKKDDYHKDHGEGLDYYSVGQTLGAGDLALFINNNLQFTKHYRTFTILDNGPLRTTFKLDYEDETIAGQSIRLSKVISIDAAQHFNKIVVSLQNKSAKETPIVVGLAKRGEANPKVDFDKDDRMLAYWEPDIKDFGQTGTALIIPKGKMEFMETDPKQFLLKSRIKNHKPFVYYNGAAWNKAGKISNLDEWEDVVEDFSEGVLKPLKVKLK